MNLKNLTYEYLDGQNIHSLRQIGGALKMQSPTSKSKSVLIDEILNIAKSGKLPTLSLNKRGRPTKVFEPISLGSSNFPLSFVNDDVLSVASFNDDMSYETIKVEGFLELLNHGVAFIRPNLIKNKSIDILVPADILSKNKLKTGMLVKGNARRYSNGVRVATNVGIVESEEKKLGSEPTKVEFKNTKEMKFFNEFCPITRGETVLLSGKNSHVLATYQKTLFENCLNKNKFFINFSASESYRDGNIFNFNIMSGKEDLLASFKLITAHMQLLNKQGHHAVSFVTDVALLSDLFLEHSMYAKIVNETFLRELFLILKPNDETIAGKTTIFAAINQDNNSSPAYLDKLYTAMDLELEIDLKENLINFPAFNLTKINFDRKTALIKDSKIQKRLIYDYYDNYSGLIEEIGKM
jgi:hypothetical protein